MAVSLEQKIACVSREIRMRVKVYPEQVKAGRMSLEKAALETATMIAILADLKAQAAAAEGPQLL